VGELVLVVSSGARPDTERWAARYFCNSIGRTCPHEKKSGITMIDKNTTDELIQLLNTRSTALVEGNLEFFEQILTDDFIYTNAGGKVFDKATYLEFFIKSGKMKWQTQELDDFNIRRYGNIAVIICRIYDQASYQGKEFEGYFRSTQVFVKQSDGWRYVAGQTTTIES
jgi:hypothetical protein